MQTVKFNDEKLQELKNSFNNVAKRIREIFSALLPMFKSVENFFRKLLKYKKKVVIKTIKNKSQKHKLNFIKPLIKHQVLDRRPKNLVRKFL